jgi:hypothetical protein
MHSKLAVLFATALCSGVVVVPAMAQPFGNPGVGGAQAGQNEPLAGKRLIVNPVYDHDQHGAIAGQPGNDFGKGPMMGMMPTTFTAPKTNWMGYSFTPASSEEMELSNQVDALVAKLGESKSDTDKDTIKTQLNEALAKQFDQRQKRHEAEIAGLEAKVKKLKELVARRQESRRDIIAKRLDQVLRDSEGLGW